MNLHLHFCIAIKLLKFFQHYCLDHKLYHNSWFVVQVIIHSLIEIAGNYLFILDMNHIYNSNA